MSIEARDQVRMNLAAADEQLSFQVAAYLQTHWHNWPCFDRHGKEIGDRKVSRAEFNQYCRELVGEAGLKGVPETEHAPVYDELMEILDVWAADIANEAWNDAQIKAEFWAIENKETK